MHGFSGDVKLDLSHKTLEKTKNLQSWKSALKFIEFDKYSYRKKSPNQGTIKSRVLTRLI